MQEERSENGPPEKQFRWVVILAVALVCFMAYLNTLGGNWVWDDASSVLLHKHVQDPSQFFQLFREDQHAFGRGQGNFYRPLVSVSFMFDYVVSGGPAPDTVSDVGQLASDLSPTVFHVTNMLWHLAAALLFAWLLSCLGAPHMVQLLAPLIYVAHPLHTEAVAYISGRADMMSAAALFAACCFVSLSFRPGKTVSGLVAATICFAAGLLSKESSLIYPVLLALILPVMTERAATREDGAELSRFQRIRPLLIGVGVLAVYMLLRATVLRFAEGAASTPAPLLQRLYETMQALGLYLKLLFIPVNLHMERVLDTVSPLYAVLGLIFLSTLLVVIILSWRRGNKRMAVGFSWFLVAWLPISGIFPLNAPMAEHWMYVPMAGFWWGILEAAHLLFKGHRTRRAVYASVFGLVAVFVCLTAQRNLDWGDNVTLFRATLAQNPNSARVHFNLAVTYEDLEHNYAGARRHYEQYLELQARRRRELPEGQHFAPDQEIEARLSLGDVLMRLQEYEEAVNVLAPLVELAETDAWKATAAFAAFKTAESMLALGELTQANLYFDRAIRLEPKLMNDIETVLSGAPFYTGY